MASCGEKLSVYCVIYEFTGFWWMFDIYWQNKKSILTDESSLAKKLARLLSKDREQPADIDHLFSLKNICFCGYHPKNDRSVATANKRIWCEFLTGSSWSYLWYFSLCTSRKRLKNFPNKFCVLTITISLFNECTVLAKLKVIFFIMDVTHVIIHYRA